MVTGPQLGGAYYWVGFASAQRVESNERRPEVCLENAGFGSDLFVVIRDDQRSVVAFKQLLDRLFGTIDKIERPPLGVCTSVTIGVRSCLMARRDDEIVI